MTKELDAIFAPADRAGAPGLVVGIAHRGRVVYRRGFGLASIEHGVANTPRTRMRLASVTKHMTCLAALLLAEDGRLDIDAPATRVLPELRGDAPTLRQLMTHTGGLRCCQELMYLGSGLAFQPKGAGMALQFAQHGVNFAPGDSQLYCNGGYGLLSLAIERAAGMPFEVFLKTRLFDPLGMADTESVPSDMQIVPGLATFHLAQPDGRWRRGIAPLEDNRGEGAVVSSVDDMLAWLAHLRGERGRRVGSAATWQQMTATATLNNGLATPYAPGLNRARYRGVEVLHHGGSLVGAASQMLTVPEHALDIIVMTNGALVNPVQMSWQVVDALLAGHLAADTEAPLATSDRFRHLFGHRYAAPSGMVYGFGDAGGLLGMSLLGSPPMPFLRDRGDVLSIRFDEAGFGPLELLTADLSGSKAPPTLAISEAGNRELYTRLPANAPPAAELAPALVGSYRADDLQADARVSLEDGRLRLRIAAPQALRRAEIEPYSDTVCGVRMTDPMAPAFPALTLDASGFLLTSGRARRIRFARTPA